MNVKRIIVFLAVTAALMVISNPCAAQVDALSMGHTSVVGTVVDEAQNPLPGIRIEVELAPDVELRNELSANPAQINDYISALKRMTGRGIFVTVTSDEKGAYAVKGLPIPGVYYLYIRNAENFLPTRLKLNLNPSEDKEFTAPPMILNPRTASGPVISEKAMKEVEKSRKAMAAKKVKEAIKHLQKALLIEPKYAEGHFNLAILFMESKKRNEAISHLEAAVGIQENYKPALKTLGELYLFGKNFQKAADYYSRYLAICEKDNSLSLEDIKVYFHVGNCYKGLKQLDKASEYFSKYLVNKEKVGQLEKNDARIAVDIAAVYYQKKDMKNSAAYYKRAITADPGISSDVYMYLGNSYLYSREGDKALIYYKKYMELDPKGKFSAQVKAMVEKLTPMYDKKEDKK